MLRRWTHPGGTGRRGLTRGYDVMTHAQLRDMVTFRSGTSSLYLVMIDVCISRDHDAFLDSCFRYSTFHSLKVIKKRKGGDSNHWSMYVPNERKEKGAQLDLLITKAMRTEWRRRTFQKPCSRSAEIPIVKVVASISLPQLKATLKLIDRDSREIKMRQMPFNPNSSIGTFQYNFPEFLYSQLANLLKEERRNNSLVYVELQGILII